MLGLEILVAADVIRTVALETTLASVAVLGLLVLVRTRYAGQAHINGLRCGSAWMACGGS